MFNKIFITFNIATFVASSTLEYSGIIQNDSPPERITFDCGINKVTGT
jgi:hypothetical protein